MHYICTKCTIFEPNKILCLTSLGSKIEQQHFCLILQQFVLSILCYSILQLEIVCELLMLCPPGLLNFHTIAHVVKLLWQYLRASSMVQLVSSRCWTCEVSGSSPGNGGLYLTQCLQGSGTTNDRHHLPRVEVDSRCTQYYV